MAQLGKVSANRYTERANIKAAERRRVLAETRQLALDIERCQESITQVMKELEVVNAKYERERTTKEEVDYLTVLLNCAKRKLAWEKDIASLKKRAPALLESMAGIMHDKDHPPSEELKAELLRVLQLVQSAMTKLQESQI